MPLSAPAPRELLHTRSVHVRGYRRKDGLWDIEGHLVDTKTYDIESEDRGGCICAGEPVHEMWLRLTIDSDFLVHDAEAVTDHSPFTMCPAVTGIFKRLKGLRIAPGWNKRVHELVGGVQGCTHLTELLGPIATTAYQTLHPEREKRRRADSSGERPRIIDTCHALAATSPIVKRIWPQFHVTTDKAAGNHG